MTLLTAANAVPAFQSKSYAGPLAVVLSLALFLAFFDRRRPFRILHLDLIALLSFAVPHALYRSGATTFVALTTFVPLAYLFVRMLSVGFRPRPSGERLLPHVDARWLVVALVILVPFRVGLDLFDSDVSDVGYASVIGADRVTKGQSIYEGGFPPLARRGYVSRHGDTYGPFTYDAYIPFEQVFPWHGTWDSVRAAHAASIAFDLLTMLGLFMLGSTLRPGGGGRELGLALSFAWASYPYSLIVLVYNTNDALVALSVVWALVLVRSPPGRGLAVGLGAAAKFVPGALAPLFATALGRRPREVLLFAGVFAATVALLFVPALPDGGVREIYDRTIGFQSDRSTIFTIWHEFPGLDFARPFAEAAAALLAVAVAFVPRRRGPLQVAALGAAVMLAAQLAHAYWFVLYIPWWTPLVLAAVLGRYETSAADR